MTRTQALREVQYHREHTGTPSNSTRSRRTTAARRARGPGPGAKDSPTSAHHDVSRMYRSSRPRICRVNSPLLVVGDHVGRHHDHQLRAVFLHGIGAEQTTDSR